MKVQDLIDILSEQDLDAEVLLLNQRSWPFEYAIAGVTCRSDLVDSEEGESGAQDDGPQSGYDNLGARDVFLLEGEQLRYGNANAWNVAQR